MHAFQRNPGRVARDPRSIGASLWPQRSSYFSLGGLLASQVGPSLSLAFQLPRSEARSNAVLIFVSLISALIPVKNLFNRQKEHHIIGESVLHVFKWTIHKNLTHWNNRLLHGQFVGTVELQDLLWQPNMMHMYIITAAWLCKQSRYL